MEDTFRIARGLRQSYKNAIVLKKDEVLEAVKLRTDCYEVLNDHHNRVYGDIDGRCLESMTQEEFNERNNDTLKVMEDFLRDKPHALMTASSYDHRKISFRFVLTKMKATKQDIKKWASMLDLPLPANVNVDTGVYGNNQKMRMLNSNKDSENRPLVLLSGSAEDTLITYLGDAETLKVMTAEEEEKLRKKEDKDKKKSEKERLKAEKEEEKKRKEEEKDKPKFKDAVIPNTTQHSILLNVLTGLDAKRFNDYETWLQIGIICYNEKLGWELWDVASRRGENYEIGECEMKYKTFQKGDLTIATLWYWLKEDNPDLFEKLKSNDYDTMKAEFEVKNFKLMNPAVFGEYYEDDYGYERINYVKDNELTHKYKNKYLMDKVFVKIWVTDPNIKTYDQVVFAPGRTLAPNILNLFRGYPVQPVEGDFSPITRVLEQVCDFNPKMMWYVENWVAWIIQKPMVKTGTILVFQGKQGVGKDTYWDLIGELIGDYFMNTLNPEHNVFTRFNDILENKLLVKFEESSYLTNKDNESILKGLATTSTFMIETKGIKSKKAPNYVNVVMTTNSDTPVSIEDSDRRFVLCRCSSSQANVTEFWVPLIDKITPDVKKAYFHYLLNLDLTDFSPRRDRVLTEYYGEVKTAHRPYHARGFQIICEEAFERNETDPQPIPFKARMLVAKLNESSKFVNNEQRVGRDMAEYPKTALVKESKTQGNIYTINPTEMKAFLIEKDWWYDL